MPEPRTRGSLQVFWSAADNAGTPALTGYDVRYSESGENNWTTVRVDDAASTALIIGGLPDSYFDVQVRAVNAGSSGPWSSNAEGATIFPPERIYANHPMIPDDLGPGDSFRLLFITEDTTDATDTGIHDYHDFSTEGLHAITDPGRLMSAWGLVTLGQSALVSTPGADARQHTDTTWTETDRGVPIYWLNGARVADDYADFYDGTWADEANPTNDVGEPHSLADPAPWTGTDHDGTELFDGAASRAVGQSIVGVGAPGSSASGAGPLKGGTWFAKTEERPLYGLWHLLVVDENLRLISNHNEQRSDATSDERDAVRAQLFTTGPHSSGYGISRIEVDRGSETDDFLGTVALHTTDGDGDPDLADGLHATLNLERTRDFHWEITAPQGTVLKPSTTYALVFQGDSGTYPELWAIGADGENVPADGWSLADALVYLNAGSWVENSDGKSLRIEIIGPALNVPGAPTSLVATASGNTRIDLSWTAPASDGGFAITGYRIEWSADGSNPWTKLATNTASAITTHEDTGLAASTTRHYRVSAINIHGAGVPSNVDDATDDDGHTLTYTLEGADAASFDILSTSGQIQTKTGVTYNHEATSTYTVIVKADDSNGGTDTVTVTITVTDVAEPPGRPAAPSVAGTGGSSTSLDVTWTAPTNTGPAITSYDLQYREGTSGSFTAGPQNETGTSAAIASLMASTSHQVQVRATNAEGDGDWSFSGTGRTGASVPGAPTSLSATASGSTQIDLSWTAPGSDGGSSITGYKIEISSDGSANRTVHVATTGNPATTYSHIGLAAGTTRHYRVSASNANGAGSPSNTDSAGDDSADEGARGGRRGDGLLERAGERDVPDRADAADVHVEGNRRLAGRRRRARSVRVRVAAERVRAGRPPGGDRDAHRQRFGPSAELWHGAPPHREGARERHGVASVHSYPEDT